MLSFKKVFHSFMIFLISFTLVNLDVVITKTALAQETDGTGVSESKISRGEDGIAQKDLTVKTEGTESKIATADFMTLITMSTMGLIAASLVQYTPTQLDMYIALAGGVIYIAGEIMAIFSGQEEITDQEFKVTIREDGEMDNKQVEALEKQKASYEAIKDTAGTKWTLQCRCWCGLCRSGSCCCDDGGSMDDC